ncbi:hypothetical protein CIRG_09630 [Coccidioides immitis RMSCC 2394]|uniref:Uncharacterized protein n=1 Tax=Coccidioides immitis RMSCC 2394 TaxID=404692 RepID=A0A0J6YP29_COCIT|nr:hypothetical protein CIRG_09630 [Coccidioides immitis RMSCC 2394]
MTMMTYSSPYQQAALLELPLGRLYPMFGGQPYMFEQTRLFSVFSSIVLGRTSPELLQHEHRLDSRLAHPPMGESSESPKEPPLEPPAPPAGQNGPEDRPEQSNTDTGETGDWRLARDFALAVSAAECRGSTQLAAALRDRPTRSFPDGNVTCEYYVT